MERSIVGKKATNRKSFALCSCAVLTGGKHWIMSKRMPLVLALIILAAGMAGSQSRGGPRGYYNKEFKVGFRYPPHWEFDGAKRPIDEEPGFTALAQVSAPENSYRGSHLHRANATIAVGSVSEEACRVFSAPNDDSAKPRRKMVGNITFYTVSGGDAAAGTVGETEIYRTFHDGRCFEVTLLVLRRNGVKPDRGVRMANDSLAAILRTFYFGK